MIGDIDNEHEKITNAVLADLVDQGLIVSVRDVGYILTEQGAEVAVRLKDRIPIRERVLLVLLWKVTDLIRELEGIDGTG